MEFFPEVVFDELVKSNPRLYRMIKDKPLIEKAYICDKEMHNYKMDKGGVIYHMLEQWQKHKVIYSIDEELYKTFIEQANNSDDVEIPLNVLNHLPYDTVAIKLPDVKFEEGQNMHLDVLATNIKASGKEHLVIRYVNKDFIGGSGIELTQGITVGQWNKSVHQSANAFSSAILLHLNKVTLQILLYLCAKNAEVETKIHKSAIKIKGKKKILTHTIKEVGHNIGRLIKKHRSMAHIEHQGGTKRPHSRCGHYHYYWCGEGRVRKELKWVAPTFIHGGSNKTTLMEVGQ